MLHVHKALGKRGNIVAETPLPCNVSRTWLKIERFRERNLRAVQTSVYSAMYIE